MLIRTPNAPAECELQHILQPFLDIIPDTLDVKQKRRPQDFIRTRKLPCNKVILSTMSLVGKGNNNGATTHLGTLFRNARRSGLWPDAQAVHPSALSKARQKVPWEVFQSIVHTAVDLAYELWPDDPQYTWHGLSVYAIDGSKFTLPATEAMRKEFDPDSGLEHAGKGGPVKVRGRGGVAQELAADRGAGHAGGCRDGAGAKAPVPAAWPRMAIP